MQTTTNITNAPLDPTALEATSDRFDLGVEELDNIVAPGLPDPFGPGGIAGFVAALIFT